MMLTTVQAAAVVGVTPARFRSLMVTARSRGVDARVPGPDARTPMWDEATLRAWMMSRPGRGNRTKRPAASHANDPQETP